MATPPVTVLANQINLPNNRSPMVLSDLTPTNDWQKWFTNVQIALNNYSKIIGWASVPPTTGTYAVNNIVFNDTPTAGGKIGWVCVTAGSPGQWKAWGPIDS